MVTNQGWPDPTEWAKRLHDRLALLGADYIATPWAVADDPGDFSGLNLKQARATEIVLAVAAALHELPLFHKSNGLAALHDVAGALHDVMRGGSPRLFTPACPGTRGGDGVDRNYLKVFVVWAVRFMMEAHGWNETKARKLVAEKFARAGATGRKGKPLSPSTVQGWCDRASPLASNGDDARIHHEVERHMGPLRARLARAPRCLARTRSGTECQSPAVSGRRRCRMHGGNNPGAPIGNRNAWKHGARSAQAIAAARYVRALTRLVSDGSE
jgi:glucans biosynthesis protein